MNRSEAARGRMVAGSLFSIGNRRRFVRQSMRLGYGSIAVDADHRAVQRSLNREGLRALRERMLIYG